MRLMEIKSRIGFWAFIAGIGVAGLVYFRVMREVVRKITDVITRKKETNNG